MGAGDAVSVAVVPPGTEGRGPDAHRGRDTFPCIRACPKPGFFPPKGGRTAYFLPILEVFSFFLKMIPYEHHDYFLSN